jgi:hypothetical protein
MSEKLIPKSKCEEMLDTEAERVVKSILQLINSVNFKPNALDPDCPKEVIHLSNKIWFAVKERLNIEITETFLKK